MGWSWISGVTGVALLLMRAADFPATQPFGHCVCFCFQHSYKKFVQGLLFGMMCYNCIGFFTVGVTEVLLQSWFTRG